MSLWRIHNTTDPKGTCYYTGSHCFPRTFRVESAKSYTSKESAGRALALGRRTFPPGDWFWSAAEVYEVRS